MNWTQRLIGLAISATLASGSIARGQATSEADEKTVATLAERLDVFFERVSSDGVASAYADLLVGGPLAKQEQQVAALAKKTSEIPSLYGAFRGFEQVRAQRIGKDVVLFKYLYKCDNFPVVWHITYYRQLRDARAGALATGSETWRVISIRFDTDLESLAK